MSDLPSSEPLKDFQEGLDVRRILETVADGVIIQDAQGAVIYVNPEAERILGITYRQILAYDPRDPLVAVTDIHGVPFGKGSNPFAEVRSTLRPIYDAEFTLVHRDGKRVVVSANISPLTDAAGQYQGTVSSFRNITRQFGLESELRRSNTELEQFAYVASHDLQEPLRMVSSYVQLLARRYREELDDEAREFIDFAVDGASRMQRLINDLLAYSRINTQGRPFAPTDANEVLQQVVTMLTSAPEANDAVVERGRLPVVTADEGQLEQLFRNLIGNALKYRRPGVPPRIAVSSEDQGARWQFSVQDNGIGIAAEHYERIFQIFQRLHSRDEYSGTGIGLALCQRIVERHGGRIWLESQPGQGTTFFFTLPKGGQQTHV